MITIRRTAAVAAIALGSLLAATAQAQTAGYDSRREAFQEHRIQQGVRSGQITAREAARLERFESQIDRMEWQARRDGVLTPSERARIAQARDALGREIYRQSHDAEVAYARAPSGWPDRRWDRR